MSYEEFAANLPLRHSMEFTSPEESEEMLRSMGVEQPVRQIGQGDFRYRLAVRSTPAADLYADRFSTAASMHLEGPAGMIAMMIPRTASGRFLASGQQLGNRKLLLLPDGAGTDIVGSDLIGSESILISQLRFSELLDAVSRMPHPARPKAMTVISGDTSRLLAMRRSIRRLLVYPELDPVNENLDNLVAATVEWIGRYSRRCKPERLCGNSAPAQVARQAQEYIEDNYREPVRLENLCNATNASARTLQRCFREYFDLTLTDYLKTVRLDTARRELKTSRSSLTSVTSVALRHGNAHLGRFSVRYCERFGESPKQTLAA
jgi:methylphosphotriester-DNA--protein-cysteine methyltransferase